MAGKLPDYEPTRADVWRWEQWMMAQEHTDDR
jgi:hypothetical protein